MKKLLIALFCFSYSISYAQTATDKTGKYLERVRNNDAELIAFFSQMPKGGDLHHHFTGSVYAETYIDYVVSNDYYINTTSLEVSPTTKAVGEWHKFSELKLLGTLADYKQKLIEKWSVKDYNDISKPSDLQFFETFGAFSVASSQCTEVGLLELKKRAKLENLSYIETMFKTIPCYVDLSDVKPYNDSLITAQKTKNGLQTVELFKRLDAIITAKNTAACIDRFNREDITATHKRLQMDDDDITFRYQNYVVRVVDPVTIFKDLLVAFESADKSPLIVGVNIVAPENNETSMRDYWLHMMMFRYCHEKFPNVKYAMHAGELTLGLVKPEELTWHITDAVQLAGARRIGHGVDIAYEQNAYDLLAEMNRRDVAIEINLYSNEFILKVKDTEHPINLYRDYKVPIVICTDDAGVLRSNLTHQYVLLTKRYKSITYAEMKQYVYNSIEYSFIEEDRIKKRLTKDLDKRFAAFEELIAGKVR